MERLNVKPLASLLAALAVLVAFAGGGCPALCLGAFAAVVGGWAWLGEIIALSEGDMFGIGDRVEVIGAGIHCGDRQLGWVGDVDFVDQHGLLVNFGVGAAQRKYWYRADALRLVPDEPEARIDLSQFEIVELYTAVRAIDKIIEGRLALISMGLATSGDDLDVGCIFEALQRELPLREAMFRAVNGEGLDGG